MAKKFKKKRKQQSKFYSKLQDQCIKQNSILVNGCIVQYTRNDGKGFYSITNKDALCEVYPTPSHLSNNIIFVNPIAIKHNHSGSGPFHVARNLFRPVTFKEIEEAAKNWIITANVSHNIQMRLAWEKAKDKQSI